MQLRVLEHPYVFDHRIADCDKCELKDSRQTHMCLSQRPTNWNGLMVVGEGPGVAEARSKTPFLGAQGNVLNALLSQAGLKREETYVTNALLCLAPRHEKSLEEDFPYAVPSCRPRLLEEIAHYQPRVIIALGRAGLLALTGSASTKMKREKLDCQTCHGELTLPNYPCGHCKAPVPYRGVSQPLLPCPSCAHDAGGVADHTEAEAKLAKRKMKCPECGGRKTKLTEIDIFTSEHRIQHVAGAVFDGHELGLPMVKYVIPSYHPSRILTKAETKAQRNDSGQFLFSPALEHFRKAARLLETDRQWPFKYEVLGQTEDQAIRLKKWIDCRVVQSREGFYAPDYFTIDIETDNKDPQTVTDIRCVGINSCWFSNPYGEYSGPIVVVTTGLPADHPTIRVLRAFLEDERCIKAAQNGILYDTQVLWRQWGIECRSFKEDTLYAHFSIAPDENHDLQHIATTFTDTIAWKPVKNKNGHEAWESSEQLHLYNARDVYNTGLSLAGLHREMAAEDSRFVYRLDVMKAHVARGMDRAGLPVDPEPYEKLRGEATEASARSLERLKEITKDPAFNPNSPAQLAKVLYDPQGLCGFVPKLFTDKGAPSTKAEALFPFRGKHPFVDELLEFRKWDRILGTYFGRTNEDGELETGIAVDSDWRIRCRWNPIGAKTGRWSSSPNLMNWPEELRGVISTAKLKRRLLFGADMPQAELRVIAALSGDDKLIELCSIADETRKFNPDYDPHSYVAAIAFPNYLDIPEWESKVLPDGTIKKFSRRKGLRDAIKAVIYGLNYGAGAAKVHMTIMTDPRYDGPPLSLEMVERIIVAIYQAFPKVRSYREKVIAAAQRTGYVRDALINRRRVYPLRDVPPTEASNYAIQATVASMMDFSLVEFACALPGVDESAMLIAQVHDAAYGECDEDRGDACSALLAEAMSQKIRLVPDAPWMEFPVTAKTAKVWAALG